VCFQKFTPAARKLACPCWQSKYLICKLSKLVEEMDTTEARCQHGPRIVIHYKSVFFIRYITIWV
jgi:hypothetical protein